MNRYGPAPEELARLLGQVAELLEVRWDRDPDLSPAPLSASQLRALFALERHEGINLQTLAHHMNSTPPSVSRLCDRLQAVGYIERLVNPTSRREVQLQLSERGRSYLKTLRARREQSLGEAVETMSTADRTALLKGLRSLHTQLDETDADSDSRSA